MSKSNITCEVARFSSLLVFFKKCLEKSIFTITHVVIRA